MRSRIRALLDQTGTHERNSPTKTTSGADTAAWSTVNANVPIAIWPIDTQVANDFSRRDIVVTDSVCTDSDIGARPADRITVGSDYYIVKGLEPYSNTKLMAGAKVYVMHCEKRTI